VPVIDQFGSSFAELELAVAIGNMGIGQLRDLFHDFTDFGVLDNNEKGSMTRLERLTER